MKAWAQIVDGIALNVFDGLDFSTEFARRFVPGFDGGHPGIPWEEVPVGTQSGAKKNQDGTFSNPSPPPAADGIYENGAFGTFLAGLLNPDPLVGRARLRKILEDAAAKTGTTDADFRTREFKDWFYATRIFGKPTVADYLADLVTSNVITSGQRTAVLNAWKKT